MFKKGLLALALVFSLPVLPLNTGSMFVFQSSISKSTFRGHQYSPEGSERAHCHRRSGKNDTVKVYCNAGRQSGQAKESLARWDIPTLRTPVA